jgi:hypothetical protein
VTCVRAISLCAYVNACTQLASQYDVLALSGKPSHTREHTLATSFEAHHWFGALCAYGERCVVVCCVVDALLLCEHCSFAVMQAARVSERRRARCARTAATC